MPISATTKIISREFPPNQNYSETAEFKGQLYLDVTTGIHYKAREAGKKVNWDRLILLTANEYATLVSSVSSGISEDPNDPGIFLFN